MKTPSQRLVLLGLAAFAASLHAEESASSPTAENPADPAAASTVADNPVVATPVSAPPGSIRLAGANGREVDFAGIWEARPEGLVVLITAEAPVSTVAWDRFDLARLRNDQPAIDAARQRAIFLRSPQPVNLGLFAGLLTPAQAGSELRRALDETMTVKVPVRYRTTTNATSSTTITPQLPVVYNGIVVNQPPVLSQNNKTVTETRFSPDELTTSPRRILETFSRGDGVASQDRRELFELVKTNPVVLETIASSLDRIAASLPPKHLLPNDPTVLTLASRLREFSGRLRALTSAVTIDYSMQILMRDLLYLADSPSFR
jgi:hypothetical protein